MTDMNFVDILFGNGNSVSHLRKDGILGEKEEEQLEWISDDFLDSILQPCTNGSYPLLDQFLVQENDTIKSFMDYSSNSVDTNSLVLDTNNVDINTVDEQNVVLDSDSTIEAFETMNYVKEEEIECEEVFESALDEVQNTFIVQQISQSDEKSNFSLVNFSTDKGGADPRDEVLNIIPQSRIKRLKTNDYSNIQRLQNKRKIFEISEETSSDDSDLVYPRLHLTPEEQKLVFKEGIKLPPHYPLTKSEERDLKRIRRKIRNKISAQDSRRRKKEYVDSLEERVKRESEENVKLLKRIKMLERQKVTLVAQVRKLQAALARCSGQTAQPSICLLVLLMSLALILAPNSRNKIISSDNKDDEGISLSEDGSSALLNERLSSRNLLFSEKNVEGKSPLNEENFQLLAEQLMKMQMTEGNVLTSALKMLRFGKFDSSLKEHDYFRPRKRFAVDFSDKSWSPTRMYSKIMAELKNIKGLLWVAEKQKNIKGSLGVAEKQKNNRWNSEEPVFIDLSD